MRSITESAGARFRRILDEANATEDQRVRFGCTTGAEVLTFDREHPEDKVFAHRGRPVLVIDPSVAEECRDFTLDYHNGAFCFL